MTSLRKGLPRDLLARQPLAEEFPDVDDTLLPLDDVEVLPTWPLSPSADGPAIVVGDVHHPVKAIESPASE